MSSFPKFQFGFGLKSIAQALRSLLSSDIANQSFAKLQESVHKARGSNKPEDLDFCTVTELLSKAVTKADPTTTTYAPHWAYKNILLRKKRI